VEWSTKGLKFGQVFANQIRRRLPAAGGKWHEELQLCHGIGKRFRMGLVPALRMRGENI